jgi:CPA2 family monovalent cation:H+ antiporter-2
VIAAGSSDVAITFIEIGAVVLALAILGRLAGRLGLSAVPFYLLAGLAVGDGGIAPLDVSEGFIEVAAEIGVLLLLSHWGWSTTRTSCATACGPGSRPASSTWLPTPRPDSCSASPSAGRGWPRCCSPV